MPLMDLMDPVIHGPGHIRTLAYMNPCPSTLVGPPPRTLFGVLQVPVPGSQVPGAWHWSRAVHVVVMPAHTPLVHVSVWVQARPSSQVVPSGCGSRARVLVVRGARQLKV